MSIKRSPAKPAPDAAERFLSGAKVVTATAPQEEDPWRVEQDPLVQVNIRLPIEMAKKLNYLAKRTGRHKQYLVAEALGPWLDEQLVDGG